jgi:hypothetical protein
VSYFPEATIFVLIFYLIFTALDNTFMLQEKDFYIVLNLEVGENTLSSLTCGLGGGTPESRWGAVPDYLQPYLPQSHFLLM